MMEGGIEYCYLRNSIAEKFACRQNAFDVIGIVQGREINTVLDPLQHPVVNKSRLLE